MFPGNDWQHLIQMADSSPSEMGGLYEIVDASN
jgi:hypothetical protein